MADTYFKQVVDGAGNVSFVPVSVADKAAPAAALPIQAGFKAAGAYVAARAGEQSTLIGAVGGAALAPTLAQNTASAIAAGLAGDYVGAVAVGLPALIGIVGTLAAIFTPDKVQGLSDEQLQSVVGSFSHEQLIGLLEQSAIADRAGLAGGGNSSGGVAGPLSTAVKTI